MGPALTGQQLLDAVPGLAGTGVSIEDDVFEGFETGLLHVITRFRGVLAEKEARTQP